MNTQVAFFPALDQLSQNPYWPLLAEALRREGVDVLPSNPAGISRAWCAQHKNAVQIVHLHYLQQHYAYERSRARFRWLLRFGMQLLAARRYGYRIVWTVHNRTPSYPLQPHWIDGLACRIVAVLADSIIVHSEYARSFVAEQYLRVRYVYVIPHPNYIGVYPKSYTRTEARAALDLDDTDLVFLFFGQLRPKKGVERLLEAFVRLSDPRARLVIAGAPGQDEEYVRRLRCLARADKRIHFRADWVPVEDVQMLHVAADVAVLPFEDVLTSGSVMLALSLGVPVIIPDHGCFLEAIDESTGIVYQRAGERGLLTSLEKTRTLDLRAMGENAYKRAAEFTWEQMGRLTVEAYQLSSTSLARSSYLSDLPTTPSGYWK